MSAPEIGEVWRRYNQHSQDVVTVFAVETCFVCVEFRDKKYENNGVVSYHREWWPRGWFTSGTSVLRRMEKNVSTAEA